MPEVLNIKIAKERAERVGLILDESTYKNKTTKMKLHDKDGYLYLLSLDCVTDKRTNGFEKVGKYNPYFVENINNFIKLNGGDAKLLTKHYVKSDEKIELQCNCGNTYTITVCHFLGEKKFVCNNCAFKNSSEKQIRNGYDESVKIVNNFGYEMIEYNKKNDIVIKDKDGYLFRTTLYSMQNMKNKYNVFSKKNEFTIKNMINYIKINNLEIDLVDKTDRIVETRKDKLEFSCKECGNPFKATWGQVAYKRKDGSIRSRCDACTMKQSNLEYTVEEYLKEKQLDYFKEYRFDDCRDKRTLPFDFYLYNNNCVIEVMGHQHYYKNDMFKQPLEDRQRVDKIKKDYCNKNNIKYVEIPSWKIQNNHEIKAYKEIINNILNQD